MPDLLLSGMFDDRFWVLVKLITIQIASSCCLINKEALWLYNRNKQILVVQTNNQPGHHIVAKDLLLAWDNNV